LPRNYKRILTEKENAHHTATWKNREEKKKIKEEAVNGS